MFSLLNGFSAIKGAIYLFFRCLLKGFLRRTTGLCELQRICYADNVGSRRAKGVEKSITLSHSSAIQRFHEELNELADSDQLVNNWPAVERAIEVTMQVKQIDRTIHEKFIDPYRISLVQVYGYRQLLARLEKVRSINYEAGNRDHQTLLRKLWTLLQPDVELEALVSKQWADIGFQGTDPSTDFRGMGLLSLENLVFFATVYTDHARNILSHSLHPVHGFPFAAVGINITHLALNLLKGDYLKTHLFNAESRLYEVEDFHKIYSYLFASFDKLWVRSKPASVMEFTHIRDKFEAAVIEKLRQHDAVFKWDPYLEQV